MDRLELTFGPLLVYRWTDVTKIAMSALSIVKTLDVIKHVGWRFISSQVARAINSLAFQYSRVA